MELTASQFCDLITEFCHEGHAQLPITIYVDGKKVTIENIHLEKDKISLNLKHKK